MELKETLEEELIRHEGVRLKPYRCTANKLTIGIGRNIEDKGITREEAIYLLQNDIRLCRAQLLATDWFQFLPLVIQNVLINMCFQLGINGLLKFKGTIAALKARNWEDAANHMLDSAWARQTPNRAHELAERVREYGKPQ